MNHNSFPSGEQAPAQQDSGDVAEFPSFEEHMQSMAQNAAEVNTQTLTRPSMKNEELPNGAQYLAHEMTEVSQKVKSGEPLNGEDITSLARACGFGQGFEKLSDFLDETGIDSGSDFDVNLILRKDCKLYDQDRYIRTYMDNLGWYGTVRYNDSVSLNETECDVLLEIYDNKTMELVHTAAYNYSDQSLKRVG